MILKFLKQKNQKKWVVAVVPPSFLNLFLRSQVEGAKLTTITLAAHTYNYIDPFGLNSQFIYFF